MLTISSPLNNFVDLLKEKPIFWPIWFSSNFTDTDSCESILNFSLMHSTKDSFFILVISVSS